MSYPVPSFITRQPLPRPVADQVRYDSGAGELDPRWCAVAAWIDHPETAPYAVQYTAWMLHARSETGAWPWADLSILYAATPTAGE